MVARWILDLVVCLTVEKSPFEGLEVTRNNPKTSVNCGFPFRKLKRVFSSRVSGILNYLTTDDIMGKGASAQKLVKQQVQATSTSMLQRRSRQKA